jgi:hypothetical protein
MELNITDNDVLDDAYNGAASVNKHKEILEAKLTAKLLYLAPCIISLVSLIDKQSLN